MLSQMGQQGVDGFRLDVVWRSPLPPLKALVLGHLYLHLIHETGVKDRSGLFAGFVIEFFGSNFVGGAEAKIAVNFDIGPLDAGLFVQFTKRAFGIRFLPIHVPFRKIESFLVDHKQEIRDRVAPGYDKAAGLQFWHQSTWLARTRTVECSFNSTPSFRPSNARTNANAKLHSDLTMKIYTKTGDTGTTGLYGGGRVSKDDARIEAYGTVDELNAAIGFARALDLPEAVERLLERTQGELFCLGAELASPDPDSSGTRWPTGGPIVELERDIDALENELPPLKNFILPYGTQATGALHLARAVCRRAERRLATLFAKEPDSHDSGLLAYLNRLGDALFVAARVSARAGGQGESAWIPPSA